MNFSIGKIGIGLGIALLLIATLALAQAVAPPRPDGLPGLGGPGPGPGFGGPMMGAPPSTPTKGAEFRLGDSRRRIFIKCADDDNTKLCMDAIGPLLNKLLDAK
jgi:hypothetical protein